MKLTKAMQAVFDDLEQRAALRFPDDDPAPDYHFDFNGHTTRVRPDTGVTLYSIHYIHGYAQVNECVMRGSYIYPPGIEANPRRISDGGRRPDGDYWLSKDDAKKALRTKVARHAAYTLLSIEKMV